MKGFWIQIHLLANGTLLGLLSNSWIPENFGLGCCLNPKNSSIAVVLEF